MALRRAAATFGLIAAAMLSGCGMEDGASPVEPRTAEQPPVQYYVDVAVISPSWIHLSVGEELVVEPGLMSCAATGGCWGYVTVAVDADWMSSDPSVATVDSDGRVRAVGRGWATIRAVADGWGHATGTVQVR